MSKKSRNPANAPDKTMEPAGVGPSEKRGVFAYLRSHLWVAGSIAILSLGAFGAGLKYLEEDAQKQKVLAAQDRSLLSSFNPFIPAPLPTATPQLSKNIFMQVRGF